MAEEEATVATVNTATEKGKEQIDEISEEDFNFQDLLGQELYHITVKVKKEACPLNLAPTSSTTAALAIHRPESHQSL